MTTSAAMLLAVWVVGLASCGDDSAASGTSGTGAGSASDPVPSFSKKSIFLVVGDPSPTGDPAPGEHQDALDGWTYVFFVADDGSITYECQHTAEDAEKKRAELKVPPGGTPCVNEPGGGTGGAYEGTGGYPSSVTGGVGPSGTGVGGSGVGGAGIGGDAGIGGSSQGGAEPFGGEPGTNPTPPGYREWFGGAHGGCGTWATAMCDRILGIRDPTTQVTETEWDQITVAIHGNAKGSSFNPDRQAYYAEKGWVVATERFDGTAADYQKIQQRRAEGCDVKLRFHRRDPDGTYSKGHVETVVGADDSHAFTNSWGQRATIQGGTTGSFSHSRDASFGGTPSAPVWPPGSTEVSVEYVCEGSVYDDLLFIVLGGG